MLCGFRAALYKYASVLCLSPGSNPPLSSSRLHAQISPRVIVCPTQAPLKHYSYKPEQVDRVNPRRETLPLAIHPPKSSEWSARFALLEADIRAALGPLALAVSHVGSTAVPDLPAKDIIDIDLTVPDVTDEAAYVPALEARGGFHFRNREPAWHGHRFFVRYSENWCNLHVWGPGCAEATRHLLMRDWLREHEEDREAYARVKREAAAASNAVGETVMDYNGRKEGWIRDFLRRIFIAKGYMTEDGQPIHRD
ncbi:GrpB domain protein [Cordyceps fumosorosea ARSEF 2679]|uniref:GrpB domain protein n=1 Tax=Cordyceps fumosorosea (strain ARSEF 2679) TaxID=1081104 RepID=A0A167P943_CORFA|nr:GrpB domain protein [Cordyceps fumosorosea ARSEF 2679]OAA56413.1 GrpB domain protein [Cordyceps fumosorosea ARSEF 2679]